MQEYYKDAPLLHWAVAHNHVKLVEWLVTLPVIVIDIYAKDKDGLTPYDLAKKNNNIELVNFFEHYTSPYNKDSRCDWPPLYWAIAGNDLEIVKCLVEYPTININEIHADNGSPLHFALSMNDTIEIANFLVKHPEIDLIQVQLSTWPPLIYLVDPEVLYIIFIISLNVCVFYAKNNKVFTYFI